MMNPALKRFAEGAVANSGILRFARARQAGRALVLAYHDIVPNGERVAGDCSLHLPQRIFAAQLDVLARTHDVVPLADALRPRVRHRRPAVAITFDDAYTGAITAGFAELARRGMPATVFVAPALLGQTTWWDLLASPVSGAVRDDVRHQALCTLRGDGAAVVRWAESSGVPVAESCDLPSVATLADLRSATRQSGITVESHSWSHLNLAALDGCALREELCRARAWLRQEFGATPSCLAYPYGLHSATVDVAAREAGYSAAFRVEGGWFAASLHAYTRNFVSPRFNVPARLSLNGFRIRLAGIATDR